VKGANIIMRTLTVNLSERSYSIYIEKGLLHNIGEEIKKIYKNRKIAIITDSNIEALYGESIQKSFEKENFLIKKILVEPGEKSKSFEVLQQVCDELLDFELTRSDLIITFGGGVVGDLGGFAASILLRGIPFIQIPTSLLAQIDSSIGGKVAVNTSRGKNLVGTFYQPLAVFIDPDLLKTLEDRYLSDGMAEVIKTAAIRDSQLFHELLQYKTKEALFQQLESIIYTCCSIKKALVEIDEKDTGERMVLNFGHTIGHGIEKYFNYETYTHGEAVAIGMYAITKSSEELSITKKGTAALIKEILTQYQLPCELPPMDKAEILSTMKLDKKNTSKNMNLILLKNIGEGFIAKINNMDIEKYINI
jgi:3-dehydroquinate synthase